MNTYELVGRRRATQDHLCEATEALGRGDDETALDRATKACDLMRETIDALTCDSVVRAVSNKDRPAMEWMLSQAIGHSAHVEVSPMPDGSIAIALLMVEQARTGRKLGVQPETDAARIMDRAQSWCAKFMPAGTTVMLRWADNRDAGGDNAGGGGGPRGGEMVATYRIGLPHPMPPGVGGSEARVVMV